MPGLYWMQGIMMERERRKLQAQRLLKYLFNVVKKVKAKSAQANFWLFLLCISPKITPQFFSFKARRALLLVHSLSQPTFFLPNMIMTQEQCSGVMAKHQTMAIKVCVVNIGPYEGCQGNQETISGMTTRTITAGSELPATGVPKLGFHWPSANWRLRK